MKLSQTLKGVVLFLALSVREFDKGHINVSERHKKMKKGQGYR